VAATYSPSVKRAVDQLRERLDYLGRLRATGLDVIEVPGPAASIIRPMIEVPPTRSAPRVTHTSASKLLDRHHEIGRGARMQAAPVGRFRERG